MQTLICPCVYVTSHVLLPPGVRVATIILGLRYELGEERTAEVGEALYRVGDRDYPFIAIIEGEVAILDSAGNEIIRHGASGFLGELNLLSGQMVFVAAVATKPLRYIAVARDLLRTVLDEDGLFSDVVLSTFIARREALQRVQGLGLEIVGPRSSKGHDADARFRAQQPPPVDMARPRARGRSRGGGSRGRSR